MSIQSHWNLGRQRRINQAGAIAIVAGMTLAINQTVAAAQDAVVQENAAQENAAQENAAQENDQAQAQSAASNSLTAASKDQPADAKTSGKPSKEVIEWSPKMAALRDKIKRTLDVYYRRPINSASRSPWALIHWTVAFGADTQVRRGGRDGKPITAVGWLCFNGNSAGQSLLYAAGNGRLGVYNGPGVQGHDGQLLAVLAQSRINIDYPMRAGGEKFTIADLVEYEKRTCRPGSELTFKLIGLSHYLPPNATWKSTSGETWDVQRLIREELAQSVRGAACGGSHRMMGFGYAVRTRRSQGEPMVGQFRRAEIFVNDYFEYTFKLQNADGSLSTSWFQGRGNSSDVARRLQTTGHMLEWLVYSLPHDQLQDARVVRAVDYLSGILEENSNRDWNIGPLGHALHSLIIYDHRVFKHWKPQGDSASAQSVSHRSPLQMARRLVPKVSSKTDIKSNNLAPRKAPSQGPILLAPQ